MDYRLIAIDLDGTLLKHDLTISNLTRQVLAKALDMKINVVICTGRMFCSAEPFAIDLGLSGYLIAHNGGYIKHLQTKHMLRDIKLEARHAWKAFSIAKQYGALMNVYRGDTLYMENLSTAAKIYTKRLAVNPIIDSTMQAALAENPTKITFLVEPKNAIALRNELISKLDHGLYIVNSLPNFIEIESGGVDKSTGLKILAEHLDIKREQIIAFGDNFNDLEMLEYAGIGIAMGNAPKEVKFKANFVTKSNEKDGIEKALTSILKL
ncbi:MAG: Cof-type HAD-IIB family hydrolase [Clostridia bacterium]